MPATPLVRDNLSGHALFGPVIARTADVLVAGERVLVDDRPTGLDETVLCRD